MNSVIAPEPILTQILQGKQAVLSFFFYHSQRDGSLAYGYHLQDISSKRQHLEVFI